MRIADDFKADMRQLYLLKERPDFVKSGKDSSLLKDAICPSVGAYGVFYPDGKDFNMNYYSAKILEFINPSAQGRVRHIRKSAAEPKSAAYMSGTVKEQQYSDCIVDFGDALENMLVGTPLPIYDGLLALQDIQILDAVSRVLSDISPRLELVGIREAIQYRVPLVSYRTAVVIKGLE